MELDLLIRDGMICRDDSPPARSSLGVRDGRIAVIAARAVGLDAKGVIDAGERLVMPGMIDPHVHIGHGAPHASEFWTEGSSAVVGGVSKDDAWPTAVAGRSLFTNPFNITGHPALSVPCGFTAECLPVGLQVIGRYYREVDALRVAAAYELITPWRARRPEV